MAHRPDVIEEQTPPPTPCAIEPFPAALSLPGAGDPHHLSPGHLFPPPNRRVPGHEAHIAAPHRADIPVQHHSIRLKKQDDMPAAQADVREGGDPDDIPATKSRVHAGAIGHKGNRGVLPEQGFDDDTMRVERGSVEFI